MWAIDEFIDGLRLTACMTLLRYYVMPKTKFKAAVSRLLGDRVPTLQHMLANATIRWLARTLTIHQFRAVTSGQADAEVLLASCPTLLEEKATSEVVTGSGYRGNYIIKFPKSTHIIFYIHGGGFVSGSPESVTPYLLQLNVELQARGVLADVFVVGYDLAPESPYPHALGQVASAYEYVRTQGKPVILAGDSAGGNLCLALLRHLVKPHPRIPSSAEASGKTGDIVAACLVSPWVNLLNESESYARNADKDCLDKRALDSWGRAYLNGQPLDEYAHPVDCVDGWKEILPPSTLLVSGDFDLFVADIQKLAEQIIQDGYDGLDMYVAPMKGHVWNLVDFGATTPGKPALEGSKEDTSVYAGIQLQASWIVDQCIIRD